MRRLVVNDVRNTLGEHTFWDDLCEWLEAEFVGGDYGTLAETARGVSADASLIVRNATWFPPIQTQVPTISLLQDIITEGPQREMQEAVIRSSRIAIFNSAFTKSHYWTSQPPYPGTEGRIIPLPVDFSIFTPQNAMGCQQALGLPDGCVCWIGASQGAAGQVKGYDILLAIVRQNPDIPFVCVFKDRQPEYPPPNMRCYTRLTHTELVRVIGACRVGLCTSRMESQHLAGIEIGACGIPMIAPPVGVYWRGQFPGVCVTDPTVQRYTETVRLALTSTRPAAIREYWQERFDKPVIKAQWTALIQEIEGAVVDSHRSDS